MKAILLIGTTVANVLMASASVYWRGDAGQPLDWFGSVSGHSYWNTAENGSGTWVDFPTGENTHVKNGGIAVVGNGESVTSTGKLVLNYNYNDFESCVRVDAGGSLSFPNVLVSHNDGTDALLHVNGGTVTIGESAAADGTRGIQVPSKTANSWRDPKPVKRGKVLVSGGLLDVYGLFELAVPAADSYSQQGELLITNGVVAANCNLIVGAESGLSNGRVTVVDGQLDGIGTGEYARMFELNNGSEFVQEGGFVAFSQCKAIQSNLRLNGGHSDFGKLYLRRGTQLTLSGNSCLTGGLTMEGDSVKEGATNAIYVAGGTLSVTNFRSTALGTAYAWIRAENPFRFWQVGGDVSFELLYLNSGKSQDVRFVVDGGSFSCGPVCVFDQPFYFRHSGASMVVFEKLTDPNGINENANSKDCLIEHVIAHGRLEPIHHAKSQDGTSSHFNVFGCNSLKPAGGVQIITNAVLPLVVCDENAEPSTTCCSGVPNEALWLAGRIGNSSRWGVTLVDEAGVGSLAGGATSFEATPFGYAALPTVKTNDLIRYGVTIFIEPKASTLTDIAKGLEAAGYENVVAIDGVEPTVTFEVPKDDLAHGISQAKLLFDFTEIRCPANFAVGGMSFPVTTNALVKAVSLQVERHKDGVMIIIK